MRFRRARAPRRVSRHLLRTERKGTARARGRRSFGASPCSHMPALPSLREVACACSALARHCARSLWGRGPARALPTRARRAALATLVPMPLEGHCTSEKPPFLRRQPVLPHASPAAHCARWLARVARLRATALALSGDEAQHVRFRRARAPRRAGDTRSMRYGRALHEREAAVPSAPGRAPTCQPCSSLREVACACSALARHCARSLWGRGPARALPTRARAAPRWRHSFHALWKGTARARSRRSFGARPVLPRASPVPHFARWLARVARLRATALALSGDEAQHVRFRRARAPRRAGGTRSMHYGRALHEREAAVPSAPARAPTCQPCPHCARWLARVARLRATALALSGDEAQHVRFRRARAAPRWRHSLHALWKGTARARSRRSFGASPCSHVPALLLTSRGGLRV